MTGLSRIALAAFLAVSVSTFADAKKGGGHGGRRRPWWRPRHAWRRHTVAGMAGVTPFAVEAGIMAGAMRCEVRVTAAVI